MAKVKDYKNLVEFLLGPVKDKPGIFLGRPEISRLPNLILGYSIGFEIARSKEVKMDEYFGEDGFLEWYFKEYPERFSSFWEESFLDEANGDQKRALEIFFDYLEKYKKQQTKS